MKTVYLLVALACCSPILCLAASTPLLEINHPLATGQLPLSYEFRVSGLPGDTTPAWRISGFTPENLADVRIASGEDQGYDQLNWDDLVTNLTNKSTHPGYTYLFYSTVTYASGVDRLGFEGELSMQGVYDGLTDPWSVRALVHTNGYDLSGYAIDEMTVQLVPMVGGGSAFQTVVYGNPTGSNIPEPSSLLLVAMLVAGLSTRRLRA